jgi:hypothetical protein
MVSGKRIGLPLLTMVAPVPRQSGAPSQTITQTVTATYYNQVDKRDTADTSSLGQLWAMYAGGGVWALVSFQYLHHSLQGSDAKTRPRTLPTPPS